MEEPRATCMSAGRTHLTPSLPASICAQDWTVHRRASLPGCRRLPTLPSLIRAARDLFLAKRPPKLWRAAANTDDAVDYIARIVADASITRSRRDLEPPEHVVVFDEAQRAFDRAKVADTHRHSLRDAHVVIQARIVSDSHSDGELSER